MEAVTSPDIGPLQQLWRGARLDPYGEAATLATASAALLLLRGDSDINAAREQATGLWRARDTGILG